MSPDAAISTFGLHIADAAVEESPESGVSYTFEQVELFGEECTLMFSFIGLSPEYFEVSGEERYLSCIFADFTDGKALQKVLKRMQEHDSYVEMNDSIGFYSVDTLTEQEKDWIETYTYRFCGEQGVTGGWSKSIDGVDHKFKPSDAALTEQPLITVDTVEKMQEDAGLPTRMFIQSSNYFELNNREIWEARYPNGIPLTEE